MGKNFITTKEAAARLGLSPITLAIWRCRRPLPLRFYKSRGNGRVTYDAADVEELAAKRSQLDGHSNSMDA